MIDLFLFVIIGSKLDLMHGWFLTLIIFKAIYVTIKDSLILGAILKGIANKND